MINYKKILISLFCCFGLLPKVIGQEYYDTICWAWVRNPQFMAVTGNDFAESNELNLFFNQKNVLYYEQAYPFARTPELLKIHEIRCASTIKIDTIIHALEMRFPDSFSNFQKIEIPEENLMTYDPIDYMWVAHNDWLWHLKTIKADSAWDITQGDTAIKTAILDVYLDLNHPDLASEVFPPFDPYTGKPFPLTCPSDHGTTVASFVSAETTKPGEISHGQLSSVGFKTKMIAYYSICDRGTFFEKSIT